MQISAQFGTLEMFMIDESDTEEFESDELEFDEFCSEKFVSEKSIVFLGSSKLSNFESILTLLFTPKCIDCEFR